MTVDAFPNHLKLALRTCLLLFITIIAALVLTACAQQESKEADSTAEPATTEYTETKIDVPEGILVDVSAEKTDSGKLWMVGTKADENYSNSFKQVPSLWELNDDNSWKELVNFNELLSLGASESVISSAITKDSKIICVVADNSNLELKSRFFLIDLALENNYRELNVDASEHSLSAASYLETIPLENNQVLFVDYGKSFYVLDIASESITRMPADGYRDSQLFLDAAILDGTVYVISEDLSELYSGGQDAPEFSELLEMARGGAAGKRHALKISTLDLSTGVYGDVSSEELTRLFSEHGVGIASRIYPTVETDPGSDRLTICLQDGIYEFSNNEVKPIAAGEETVLADTSKDILGHVFDNKEDFFLLVNDYCVDESTSTYSLYKYEKVA